MKAYKRLKAKMYAQEVTQADLAKELNRSTSYVATRLSGHSSFLITDALHIAEFLSIPREEIFDYFLEPNN